MRRGSGSITFDVVGETMNTWTEEAFTGFDRVMQELEIAKGIRGIIFISGKPENFLAGANLKLISQIESAEEVRRTLELFHGSFARLDRPGDSRRSRRSTATASAAAWNSRWPARPGSPRRGRPPSSACRSATSGSSPAAAGRSACPG